MASHKDFIQNFSQKIPQFMEKEAHNIYEDIVNIISENTKKNGVEIRRYFSITQHKREKRDRIIFKDLTSQQPLEPK